MSAGPPAETAETTATNALDPAEARRRYREFVLRHHPDRGGDRETFEAGLAAHRAALIGARSGPSRPAGSRTTVVAHRAPGVGRAVRRWWRRQQRSRP